MFGGPPEMFAETVADCPNSTNCVGQSTVIVGHNGTQSHSLTVTVVDENDTHPHPSSTSTVAVYVPGVTPARFHVTFGPSPVICPPVVEYV